MPSSSASNSKTSSASGSIDTALVQDKEDEPETKKEKYTSFREHGSRNSNGLNGIHKKN